MNPELSEIVSPRRLRQSPTRATISRIQPPARYSGQPGQLRVPGAGIPPGRLVPPGSGIRAPSAGAAFPASRLPPPSTPSHSKLLPPLDSRLRLTSTLRKPSSIAHPSGEIPLKTPQRTARRIPRPGETKLIPLPGSSKLAAIPKPTRLHPPQYTARLAVPVTRLASTSLLPKPAFIQTPRATPRAAPGADSRLRTPFTRTRPSTTASSTPPVKTPAPRTLPPTTIAKSTRRPQPDDGVVTYRVAGRDIEFVDWAPSPEPTPAIKPVRKPVRRELLAEPKPKKIYEFPEEPSVIASKQFASKLRTDLSQLQHSTAEMQALKAKKGAILERLKTIYSREGRPPPESETVDMPAFREKYGVTQSPKMRQLLDLTAEWNRELLERREFEDSLAQAQGVTVREQHRQRPELSYLKESPGGVSPDVAARRAERELARRERIDNYKQRAESQKEYRRLLEERKRNVASRRPYSREEREDIRRRYEEAREFTYTAPTEEELDNALRMAEIMELAEEGVSMTDAPEKVVESLFPETAPTTEIVGAAGDAIVPQSIPVEEINTINSLDRGTAEIALNASLVPAPSGDAAKAVLEKSIQEIATRTVQTESESQELDSFYDIELKLNRPKKENFVQLQGSSLPSWFPGYHTIYPGFPGLIQTTKSPSSVLLTALRKLRPSSTSSM